ncbi:MAG: undecaprenyl-phosphate glucose phosphotransferase [Lachnospiraceae bacterium]|nr:undecaprenyl-phosphate glucose phosphotransferase [Lachnospiraceae bacterium]
MIKDNQKHLNRIHVVIDAVIIVIAYFIAYWLIFGFMRRDSGLPKGIYFSALLYIVPGGLILYWFFHLYEPMRVMGRRLELFNVLKANVVGAMLITLVLYLGKDRLIHFSRQMTFLFIAFNYVLESTFRLTLRSVLRSFRRKGYNQKHVLLIGYSRAAQSYIDRVVANPDWGYLIRGILDDHASRGTEYRGVRVMGPIDNLEEILPMNRLDEIAITLSINEYDKLERIVNACEKSGVHTKFIPDYNKVIPTKPYTEDLLGLPVINIRNVPLTDSFNAALKRLVDILGAGVGIIVFSPIMLIVAAVIKFSSPGPVIFSQERVGLHNRSFKMYKFRSMEVQKPSEEKAAWTTRNDPRVTPVGKFIRKTSIDELPQLFNILKGDMSLVGPRPERPHFVEKFREEVPRYMVKHQVRPGLTGWAQVNGYRGDTSITKRIECDLYYIENWSLGLDFKIIFLTFFKGFVNKNAY